jgi:hypothetical protein
MRRGKNGYGGQLPMTAILALAWPGVESGTAHLAGIMVLSLPPLARARQWHDTLEPDNWLWKRGGGVAIYWTGEHKEEFPAERPFGGLFTRDFRPKTKRRAFWCIPDDSAFSEVLFLAFHLVVFLFFWYSAENGSAATNGSPMTPKLRNGDGRQQNAKNRFQMEQAAQVGKLFSDSLLDGMGGSAWWMGEWQYEAGKETMVHRLMEAPTTLRFA